MANATCVRHMKYTPLRLSELDSSEYRRDAERGWEEHELVLSADMMRVSMLPVLPHKVCMFTRRIVANNETFSILHPSGQKRNSRQKKHGLAVLWHEGVAEHKAGDVAWRAVTSHC